MALDHDPKSAKFSAGVDAHVLVKGGREESGVDIKGAKHSIDDGKLDLSELYVTAIVLFDKSKNGLELVGNIGDHTGWGERKGFGLLIDVDRDTAFVFGKLNHDRRDGHLKLLECFVEHLLWADLLGVDIIFFDEPSHLFHIKHIGKTVAPELGVCGWKERNPRGRSPSAQQTQRKEGDEHCPCTSLHP